MKKICIIFIALLFAACGSGDHSDKIGDNGLPASLSIFPSIDIFQTTDARPARAREINMTIELENTYLGAFREKLIRAGFIHTDYDLGDEYIRENAHCYIYESVIYQTIVLVFTEPIYDNYIREFYSYFPEIPGDKKHIRIEFDDLDPLSLASYTSMLEARGFERKYRDEYRYDEYCYVPSGSDSYGYSAIISNIGCLLGYAD